MRLVKLDAIDSTNDFLKDLSNKQPVENFTVVTAENQTKGKGQMGSVWTSEVGKNLIMSVLVKNVLTDINTIYDLNIVVALAVIQTLQKHNIPKLSIKWPNDIMSGDKKIGGILIENSIKSDGSINSIVGLGLNVNQTNFENLPKASSLALVAERVFDKEILLVKIVGAMKANVSQLSENPVSLWQQYTECLFKKGIPVPFEDETGSRFMGIIQGVKPDGKIRILCEDDSEKTFEIKEIQMLY